MNREYIIRSLEETGTISSFERNSVISWVRKNYPNYISTIKDRYVSETFRDVLEHIKNNLPEKNQDVNQ